MNYASYGFDGRSATATHQNQTQDMALNSLMDEINFLGHKVLPLFQFVYPGIKKLDDLAPKLKSEGKLFWLRTLSEHLRYKSTSIIDSSPISNLFTPPNPSNPFDINNDYNNPDDCVRKNPILWAYLCLKLANDSKFAESLRFVRGVKGLPPLEALQELTNQGDYKKIGELTSKIGNLPGQLMGGSSGHEEYDIFVIFRPLLFPEKFGGASQTQRVSQVYQNAQPSSAQPTTTFQAAPSNALIDLQNELARLKAENQMLIALQTDHAKLVKQLSQRAQDFQTELARVNAENQTLRVLPTEYAAVIEKLNEEKSELQVFIKQVQAQYANAPASNANTQTLERKLNEAWERNKQLVEELHGKESAIKQLQADLGKYQTAPVAENVKTDAERYFSPFMKCNPLKSLSSSDAVDEKFMTPFREMISNDELFKEIKALLQSDPSHNTNIKNYGVLLDRLRRSDLNLGFLNPTDDSFKHVVLWSKEIENYYPIYFMLKKMYLNTSNDAVRTLIKQFLDKTTGIFR